MGMNKQVVKNAEFDRIADSLLKSSALKHDEIDEIVARKDLFLSVKRRVIVEETRRPKSGTALIFKPRMLSYAALVAVAVITVISAVEAIVNRTKGTPKTPISVSYSGQSTSKPQKEQQPAEIYSKDVPPESREVDNEPPVLKPNRERPTITRASWRPPKNETPDEQPLEFYALADMNSMEPVSGGRVIRVDLPRASLVSLGVNIPLGSDKQLIKTDLLIGPDGVPRAIRLVE